jgi:hypothetical protein
LVAGSDGCAYFCLRSGAFFYFGYCWSLLLIRFSSSFGYWWNVVLLLVYELTMFMAGLGANL